MARIVPLWRSAELSVHRFDHPLEHEDRPYEAAAATFAASFVEQGSFDLEIADDRWRIAAGDVMLRHPGMHFRAGFEGEGFDDTCLTITYLAAGEERFDEAQSWARSPRPVLRASNRVRYLYWRLKRAIEESSPMLAELCATEIFREREEPPSPLLADHRLAWYAERVHAACETMESALDRNHTISDLARSVGMSMFHFSRVFAKLVGQTPHRYLCETRLRAARAMLLAGASVTETCYACGFNNLSHFSRSFTRQFGVPPSQIARRE